MSSRAGRRLRVAGLELSVHALGPGESHADSYWELHGPLHVAFIGDVVLNGEHAYTNDGHTRAWLQNLQRLQRELAGVSRIYPGHGPAGDLGMLAWQIEYLTAYRAEVEAVRAGGKTLTDEAKQALLTRMRTRYPHAGLEFMVQLGADTVASELAETH